MAQDLSYKRRRMATNAIAYAQQLTAAIAGLQDLVTDRAKLSQDFQDSDFATDTNLQHLTAAMVGTLFDFVVGTGSNNDITKWLADAGNGGRNVQILMQVRGT